MMNKFPSIRKLKYTLLSFMFTLLFIPILHPEQVYAEDKNGVLQVENITNCSTNDQEETTGDQAGYLYWAASGERCGIMVYVIDEVGRIQANMTYLEQSGGDYESGCIRSLTSKINSINVNKPKVEYKPNVSTVVYSNGWQAKGCSAMNMLIADSDMKWGNIILPNWAKAVVQSGGTKALKHFMEQDVTWTVWAEPVSCQYIYTNDTFQSSYIDGNTVDSENPITFEKGDPKPEGSETSPGVYTPTKLCFTAARLAVRQALYNPQDGGTYTYKFLNKALPWSLCVEHDQSFGQLNGKVLGTVSAPSPVDGHRLTSNEIDDPSVGIAIAAIEVKPLREPIHTFGGSTPGNTEIPSEDNFTTGNCTIKKLYYTQIIASDGTILTEATDYHPYTRTLTTNYISIDNEEGYEIEGWKTSTYDKAFTQKSHYDGISPVKQSGTSSDVITLDETTGEKYLYVLLKKTEIETNPPDPWDFQLKQSQITKRVTFLESSGPANTPDLIIHNFKWTAPAPAITSCIAHGGDGHKYNHSCGRYSCSTWYTHPCSSFQWTDNTTKLGIKIDTTAINKAVVSKNHEVTYNATTVNTIESCVTHMGLFFFCIF